MGKVILGIDPDLKGCLTFLDIETQVMDIVDMPVVQKGKSAKDISKNDLLVLLMERQPSEVWIEYQQASPRMGVSSAFSHGKHYGLIIGILTAYEIPIIEIPAAKWKSRMGLDIGAGKNLSIYRASKIMPSMAEYWKDVTKHGRAESALITFYGALVGSNAILTNIIPGEKTRLEMIDLKNKNLFSRKVLKDSSLELNDDAEIVRNTINKMSELDI